MLYEVITLGHSSRSITPLSNLGTKEFTMAKETQATGLKGWIGYRPEIKVLDATIRDGGLMNDHKFDHEFSYNFV